MNQDESGRTGRWRQQHGVVLGVDSNYMLNLLLNLPSTNHVNKDTKKLRKKIEPNCTTVNPLFWLYFRHCKQADINHLKFGWRSRVSERLSGVLLSVANGARHPAHRIQIWSSGRRRGQSQWTLRLSTALQHNTTPHRCHGSRLTRGGRRQTCTEHRHPLHITTTLLSVQNTRANLGDKTVEARRNRSRSTIHKVMLSKSRLYLC